MTRALLTVPLLAMVVLLSHALPRAVAASDLLDFFRLRATILQESEPTLAGRDSVSSSHILGSWARWRGVVERVMEPQEGLWLILVEMDPPGESSPSHNLEVWTDNPAAAELTQGQAITVKGTIVDYRRLPGAVVRIVIDARS